MIKYILILLFVLIAACTKQNTDNEMVTNITVFAFESCKESCSEINSELKSITITQNYGYNKRDGFFGRIDSYGYCGLYANCNCESKNGIKTFIKATSSYSFINSMFSDSNPATDCTKNMRN